MQTVLRTKRKNTDEQFQYSIFIVIGYVCARAPTAYTTNRTHRWTNKKKEELRSSNDLIGVCALLVCRANVNEIWLL